MSSVNPDIFIASELKCECVVLPGWMSNVFASPTFAKWEESFTFSINALPASLPPLIPNTIIDPDPNGKIFFAIILIEEVQNESWKQDSDTSQ